MIKYRVLATGELLDQFEMRPDGTVSYATGAAEELVSARIEQMGVDGALEYLADWTNGYLATKAADPDAKSFKHLPGQHNQHDHAGISSINAIAGIDVMDAAQYADEYGDVWDDAGVDLGNDGDVMGLTARFFERGDLHVVLDLDDDKRQVFEEMDPEGMRQLAYNLEEVLAVDESGFDGGDPYDIVADADSDKHGFYVAKDGVGDIRIRPPDAADDDYLEMSAEQALKFSEALLNIADSYEEHFDGDGEAKAVKHPGHPDQSVHGRRRKPPSVDIPSVPMPPPEPEAAPSRRRPARPKPPKPTPSPAVAPTSRPPKKFPKGAPEFFEGRRSRDLTPDEIEEVEAAYGGEFAGFIVTGISATLQGNGCTGSGADRGPCTMSVKGDVTDASGKVVGKFSRALDRKRDGSLVARHDLLTIDPQVQGQGFAQAFNANLESWYRESGISRVELHANIDVGGYAWARAGYDWADVGAARKIGRRVRDASIDTDLRGDFGKIPADRLAEQQQLAADMASRMKSGFGTEGYPTPFEVANLGRWPGAGRDDWWIGKAIMMNSDWMGAKPL